MITFTNDRKHRVPAAPRARAGRSSGNRRGIRLVFLSLGLTAATLLALNAHAEQMTIRVVDARGNRIPGFRLDRTNLDGLLPSWKSNTFDSQTDGQFTINQFPLDPNQYNRDMVPHRPRPQAVGNWIEKPREKRGVEVTIYALKSTDKPTSTWIDEDNDRVTVDVPVGRYLVEASVWIQLDMYHYHDTGISDAPGGTAVEIPNTCLLYGNDERGAWETMKLDSVVAGEWASATGGVTRTYKLKLVKRYSYHVNNVSYTAVTKGRPDAVTIVLDTNPDDLAKLIAAAKASSPTTTPILRDATEQVSIKLVKQGASKILQQVVPGKAVLAKSFGCGLGVNLVYMWVAEPEKQFDLEAYAALAGKTAAGALATKGAVVIAVGFGATGGEAVAAGIVVGVVASLALDAIDQWRVERNLRELLRDPAFDDIDARIYVDADGGIEKIDIRDMGGGIGDPYLASYRGSIDALDNPLVDLAAGLGIGQKLAEQFITPNVEIARVSPPGTCLLPEEWVTVDIPQRFEQRQAFREDLKRLLDRDDLYMVCGVNVTKEQMAEKLFKNLKDLLVDEATLQITTEPRGAALWVNNQEVRNEKTPCEYPFAPPFESGTTVNVSVRLEGYKPADRLVKIEHGHVIRLHFNLQPLPSVSPATAPFPLVYLAILLIGFSFILRPVLGRSANGLILIAFAMIGISLFFDLLRSDTFAWGSLLVILALVILLGRKGLGQLQGRR